MTEFLHEDGGDMIPFKELVKHQRANRKAADIRWEGPIDIDVEIERCHWKYPDGQHRHAGMALCLAEADKEETPSEKYEVAHRLKL